jgi:hypothetical protein
MPIVSRIEGGGRTDPANSPSTRVNTTNRKICGALHLGIITDFAQQAGKWVPLALWNDNSP